MLTFRYSLDSSSKKFVCPNCNKKTFVKYMDNESGNYLAEDYGRCDRESKCNYHKAPEKGDKAYLINFLSLEDVSDKALKGTDENGFIRFIPKSQVLELDQNKCWLPEWFLSANNFNFSSNPSRMFYTQSKGLINVPVEAPEPPKETSFHSLELLDEMYFEDPVEDNLLKFLKKFFTAEEVFKAMQKYFITGTNSPWNNSTVFWQIDENEQIRGGKIMLYNASTGKRVKEPYNHINWIHKARKEEDFNLNQCLFGLYLTAIDKESTIAIVESEKTAVIMSIVLPQFIWLATGNKQNLKPDFLKPIKKRNVVVYPDKGEFDYWSKKAEEMNTNGFRISVSDLIENQNYKQGFDLADLFVEQSNNDKHSIIN